MTLIPFILDLADELNEFNRSLATATVMDVDDSFGFGIYAGEQPHHHLASSSSQQQTSSSSSPSHHSLLSPQRRTRLATPLYWVPSSLRQRHHPYHRFGNKTACCNKTVFEVEKELAEKESAATSTTAGGASGSGTASGSSAGGSAVAKSSYSVVNKNGFQVSMNVKQFAPDELTVKTIDNCIVVEGQHDEKEDGHGVISRHFIRKYMLPKGYDPNQVLSTLSSDGILTVKAPPPPPPTPVVKAAEERPARIVDIQQTGEPTQIPLAKDAQTPTKPTTSTPTTAAVDQQQPKVAVPIAVAASSSSSNTVAGGGGAAAAAAGTVDVDDMQKKSAGKDSERNGDDKNIPVTSVAAVVATAEENSDQLMETSNGENAIAVQKEQKPNTDLLFEVPSARAQLGSEAAAVVIAAADVVEPTSTEAVVAEDSTANNSSTKNGLIASTAVVGSTGSVATAVEKPTTEDVEMTSADTTTTPTNATASGIELTDEAAQKLVASTTPLPPAPTPSKTGGELLAAADAAILLAKTQCENGGAAAGGDCKMPTEKVAN